LNKLNTDKDSQAVLLLCGRFGDTDKETLPLTLREYNVLAAWLKERELRPANMFGLREPDYQDISFPLDTDRIQRLMNRGASMAMAMERWLNQGIWVITRTRDDYPERLRQHLGNSAPPILFGVGNVGLLEMGGLAIVGSRTISPGLTAATEFIAAYAARNGIGIISGGAKGVDQTAMSAAIREGGRVIGVLSERLMRESSSKTYREGILEGKLVLVSPYQPEAPFDVGNAMGRNKCIYSLADAALAMSSSYEQGGTWAGLLEEKKRPQGRPLFIWSGAAATSENMKVRDKLGISGLDERNINQTLFAAVFRMSGITSSEEEVPPDSEHRNAEPGPQELEGNTDTTAREPAAQPEDRERILPDEVIAFLMEFRSLDELGRQFNYPKQAILEMLGKAIRVGDVVKQGRPVKYKMSGQERLL
jgi:predicted Rossmann fold nucleotide-binding protein DprA/Smf involved in DNA uptake